MKTKKNGQRRPRNNSSASSVAEDSSFLLVPPQGLELILWARPCELSCRFGNPQQVEKLTIG